MLENQQTSSREGHELKNSDNPSSWNGKYSVQAQSF